MTSESFFIDRALITDTNNIVNIINQAYWPSHSLFLKHDVESQQRVSSKGIQDLMRSPNSSLYVLKEKVSGAIVGTFCLQQVAEEPHATKLGLLTKNPDKKYQELKVGELLIKDAVRRAYEMGKLVLKIEVVTSSDPSLEPFLSRLVNYYKGQGFKETGKTLPFPRNSLKNVQLTEMEKNIAANKL